MDAEDEVVSLSSSEVRLKASGSDEDSSLLVSGSVRVESWLEVERVEAVIEMRPALVSRR